MIFVMCCISTLDLLTVRTWLSLVFVVFVLPFYPLVMRKRLLRQIGQILLGLPICKFFVWFLGVFQVCFAVRVLLNFAVC